MSRLTRDQDQLWRDLQEVMLLSPHVRMAFDAWRSGAISNERDALLTMVRALWKNSQHLSTDLMRCLNESTSPTVFGTGKEGGK